MAGEWREMTWGDLASLEYGRGLRGYEDTSATYRVYGTNGPIGWHYEPLCPHATVVIGRKGAYRGVHYSPEACFVIDTAFYLEPRVDLDIRWAYYELLTHDINSMDSGSAIPSTSRDAFYRLPVRVPPIAEQRAIAAVLGALDDKIELNRQMCQTLEGIARALFESWFVRFDPVRRNMARKGHGQPSPGLRPPSTSGRGIGGEGAKHEGEGRKPNYRGGYDFAGLVETARALRQKQTPAEAIFWELVRNRRFLGLKFRRQHPLGDYVADFYCHEHRLVIEFDGGVHSEKQRKDRKRDAWMAAQGFKVLRFKNEQLLDDPESVLSAIAQVVEELPSPCGRRAEDEGVVESAAFDHLFPDRLVDSPLGPIPEGWCVGTLGEHFKLTMGQSPPGSTYNEEGRGLPFYQGRTDFGFRFPTRRVYCTEPTRFAEPADTLVSVRAPVGDVNMAWERCAVGRGVAAVRHKSGAKSFTFYAVRALREHFERFEADGTVFGAIGRADFERLPFVSPSAALIAAFEESAGPLDTKVELSARESDTLAALRDALLPKLVSGELRIRDVERIIERCA